MPLPQLGQEATALHSVNPMCVPNSHHTDSLSLPEGSVGKDLGERTRGKEEEAPHRSMRQEKLSPFPLNIYNQHKERGGCES